MVWFSFMQVTFGFGFNMVHISYYHKQTIFKNGLASEAQAPAPSSASCEDVNHRILRGVFDAGVGGGEGGV